MSVKQSGNKIMWFSWTLWCLQYLPVSKVLLCFLFLTQTSINFHNEFWTSLLLSRVSQTVWGTDPTKRGSAPGYLIAPCEAEMQSGCLSARESACSKSSTIHMSSWRETGGASPGKGWEMRPGSLFWDSAIDLDKRKCELDFGFLCSMQWTFVSLLWGWPRKRSLLKAANNRRLVISYGPNIWNIKKCNPTKKSAFPLHERHLAFLPRGRSQYFIWIFSRCCRLGLINFSWGRTGPSFVFVNY